MSPSNVTIGTTIAHAFSISDEEMVAFARLSGDRNPLHSDREFARSGGFDAPVVYGGLLVAKISELLGMSLPGPGCVWVSVNVVFMQPLYVGESATLEGTVVHVSPSVNLMKIKHVIRKGEQLVLRGTSEVRHRG